MIGPLILGGLAAAGAARANSAASQSVDRAHDFSERMSNTAYQRAMSDMRSAGLNPILAAKLGGASTPTGQTYTPQNIGAAFGQGFSQGSTAMQSQAQTKKIQEETVKVKQEVKNLKVTGVKLVQEVRKVAAEVGLVKARQAVEVVNETLRRAESLIKQLDVSYFKQRGYGNLGSSDVRNRYNHLARIADVMMEEYPSLGRALKALSQFGENPKKETLDALARLRADNQRTQDRIDLIKEARVEQ